MKKIMAHSVSLQYSLNGGGKYDKPAFRKLHIYIFVKDVERLERMIILLIFLFMCLFVLPH